MRQKLPFRGTAVNVVVIAFIYAADDSIEHLEPAPIGIDCQRLEIIGGIEGVLPVFDLFVESSQSAPIQDPGVAGGFEGEARLDYVAGVEDVVVDAESVDVLREEEAVFIVVRGIFAVIVVLRAVHWRIREVGIERDLDAGALAGIQRQIEAHMIRIPTGRARDKVVTLHEVGFQSDIQLVLNWIWQNDVLGLEKVVLAHLGVGIWQRIEILRVFEVAVQNDLPAIGLVLLEAQFTQGNAHGDGPEGVAVLARVRIVAVPGQIDAHVGAADSILQVAQGESDVVVGVIGVRDGDQLHT